MPREGLIITHLSLWYAPPGAYLAGVNGNISPAESKYSCFAWLHFCHFTKVVQKWRIKRGERVARIRMRIGQSLTIGRSIFDNSRIFLQSLTISKSIFDNLWKSVCFFFNLWISIGHSLTICQKDLKKSMQFRQLSKIDLPIVKDLGSSRSHSRNSFSPCTSSQYSKRTVEQK